MGRPARGGKPGNRRSLAGTGVRLVDLLTRFPNGRSRDMASGCKCCKTGRVSSGFTAVRLQNLNSGYSRKFFHLAI